MRTPGPPLETDRLARFVVCMGRLATSAMMVEKAGCRCNPARLATTAGWSGMCPVRYIYLVALPAIGRDATLACSDDCTVFACATTAGE